MKRTKVKPPKKAEDWSQHVRCERCKNHYPRINSEDGYGLFICSPCKKIIDARQIRSYGGKQKGIIVRERKIVAALINETVDPGRNARIERLAARAALGLPLFDGVVISRD